jgi:predicted phage tail protein
LWIQERAAGSSSSSVIADFNGDGRTDLAAIANFFSSTASVLLGNQTGSFTGAVATIGVAPTDIALSASSIAENLPSGTTVGTLSTTDPDIGDTFTYTLVSGDTASFTIVGGELRTAAVFSFATKSSHSVRVRSTDRGTLFTEKTFTIAVLGRPAAPTNLSAVAGEGRATLTWTAPANNGAAITDYKVEYSSNAGSSWTVFPHAASTATTIAVTGLVDGTYVFRASAVNSVGTGTPSATSTPVVRSFSASLRPRIGEWVGSL